MTRRPPGLIIPSPGFPLTAMWIAFWSIILLVGIPVVIKLGFKMRSWSEVLTIMPWIVGLVVIIAVVVGLFSGAQTLIQGWAWRKLVEDTPVADDDQPEPPIERPSEP